MKGCTWWVAGFCEAAEERSSTACQDLCHRLSYPRRPQAVLQNEPKTSELLTRSACPWGGSGWVWRPGSCRPPAPQPGRLLRLLVDLLVDRLPGVVAYLQHDRRVQRRRCAPVAQRESGRSLRRSTCSHARRSQRGVSRRPEAGRRAYRIRARHWEAAALLQRREYPRQPAQEVGRERYDAQLASALCLRARSACKALRCGPRRRGLLGQAAPGSFG